MALLCKVCFAYCLQCLGINEPDFPRKEGSVRLCDSGLIFVNVSGAPAPAPPRAVTRQPSVHGQGETYQIINTRDLIEKY